MYIANHYVRVNGKVYTSGERIPDGLPESKIRWLLEAGAVHEAVSAQEAAERMERADDTGMETQPAEEPEAYEDSDDPADMADEDEPDDDAEAPEIDVMAGVV